MICGHRLIDLDVSGFDTYADAPTRAAMVAFVARARLVEPAVAERELRSLNHVGLAYVRRDMLAAEAGAAAALADYDPVWGQQ